MDTSYHTYSEIKMQTAAWKEALAEVRKQSDRLHSLEESAHQLIFTGCGSTYYLSLAGAALFQQLTGKNARAVPASELLLNTDTVINTKPSERLLVAVSRSGTTSETLKAVDKFKGSGMGKVLVVTNYVSPLSELADLSIVIPTGQEESVAQTRSFASMFVAVTAFAAAAAGRVTLLEAMQELPTVGDRLMEKYEALARDTGANLDYDRFYFLGSGYRYGLACEANLKMKEMSLSHSEPFHFLEFRHGPMSMITKKTVVIGLLSEKNRHYEQAVLDEMQAKGARILMLANQESSVQFEVDIPESVYGVLYLPVLQLLAFYRSLSKSLNPDRPNALTAVVKLDL